MRLRFPFAALIAAALTGTMLVGCSDQSERLSFRLWDPQVAEAYRASFDEFEERTGLHVEIVVVPWADYWTQLRADIAAGVVDDVFWTNATNYIEYAEAGALVPIDVVPADWEPSVVAQYTFGGRLWGVPQLTDLGIGVIYNADLLRAAGLVPADLEGLEWDPAASDDGLKQVARALTLDSTGRHPGEPGFDPARVVQYGYSAANDLNAILLPFVGSNGASWQVGDRFSFASEAGIEAIGYLVELVDRDHVAPAAIDTNPPTGGDFGRDQFLQGHLALFQTGAYNLANVMEGADFAWGVAPLPAGPAGAISVTNGIVAAASTSTDVPDAQRTLLEWLGSAEGSEAIGASGSALPAVIAAQTAYLDYWRRQGLDISPMLNVLANGTIQPPRGTRYGAADAAMQPILNEIFLGRRDVAEGVIAAQDAANAAIEMTAPSDPVDGHLDR